MCASANESTHIDVLFQGRVKALSYIPKSLEKPFQFFLASYINNTCRKSLQENNNSPLMMQVSL